MEVINYKDISSDNWLFGKVKEGLHDDISFARAEMVEGISTAHFHKNTVEYYLILEGNGILRTQKIDGEEVVETELEEGVLVRIDKNETHQTDSKKGLVLETISIPAWTEEDENESEVNLFKNRNS
ncbi:hypothetical protein C4544_04105 [candidate division WS5 bacterium]|uniref:Cupin domain-containing protein n=1 Tax=candidate division WS5 bacterium TaxID=2093353 RepID=A0A419DCV7_9BACT|nr:MAG: hypothetical protein C4544_04105 [candidate division WS5 bacterium]